MANLAWMTECLPTCNAIPARIGTKRVQLPVKYKQCWFDVRRFAAGVAVAATEIDMFDTNAAVTNSVARFFEQPVRGCEMFALMQVKQFKLDPWQLPTEIGALQGVVRGFLNENEKLDFETARICTESCESCDIAATGNTITWNTGDSLVSLGGNGICQKRGLTSEDRYRISQTNVAFTPRANMDIFTMLIGYLVGYDGDQCKIDVEAPPARSESCDDVAALPDGSDALSNAT